MANDLKPMLAKVLASGGEKKFFFAYGVGKRKDKKGDGELVVGGKKPKKPEIEGALDGCKEHLEGVCWVGKGPNDAETVYFQGQGKKLSQMVVAKMALTAKALTGRQQDFQLPSPEEEARAEKFKAGEVDEAPGTPAAPVTPPTDRNATEPAAKRVAEPAAKATTGDDLAAPWKARLAEWSPAIKAALAAQGPNAAEIAKLLAQATALSKPGGDMPQALAKLTECHDLATKAIAAPAAGTPPADLSAKWKALLEKWTPHLKATMAAKGPNAADIAKLLAQATALSKPGGDMPQALAKLTQCQPLVKVDWTRRVSALEPKVLEAQKSRKGDAKWMSMFMTAQDTGGEDDFAKSFTILDKLEGLLNAKPGDAGPPSTGDKAPAAGAPPEKSQNFAELMARLEPELLNAQKANPDARASLGNLWTFAVQQVDAGDEEKAKTAFARLEKAIADALANAPKTDTERFGTRAGLVAERRAELEKFFTDRLATAEAATEAQVSSVEKAIAAKVPDEDPQFLASAIQHALDEKYEQVWNDLHKPIESASATAEEILSLVEKKRTELTADPLVKILQKAKSELGVAADVSIDFGKLLDEVVAKVKALAAN